MIVTLVRKLFVASFYLCTFSLVAQSIPGLVWDDDPYLKLPFKMGYGEKKESPPRYSLKLFCPKVVNQKGMATSAAWATVWYAQTIAESISCLEGDRNAITERAFAPLYPYRISNPTGDCTTPMSLTEILLDLSEFGTPRFKEFNDLCPISIPSNLTKAAAKNKLDGFVKLFNPFDPQDLKIQSIKDALSHGHPVVIGMITPPSFVLADQFWQPRERPDTTFTPQALCIVGYDNEKFGGAVEIVNQWGKSWGDNGFTWIRYEDLHQFARYGFEIIHGSTCFAPPEASLVLFDSQGRVLLSSNINNNKLQLERKLPIGSKFKISITPTNSIYFYLLFKEDDKIVPLFPQDSKKIYPLINVKIILPENSGNFVLEGKPQSNHLYLIASKVQLDTSLLQAQAENESLFRIDESDPSRLIVNQQFGSNIKLTLLQIDQF